MIAIDWNATTIAGGFIVGVIIGGAAMIRVFRWVLDYMAHRDRHEPHDSDD